MREDISNIDLISNNAKLIGGLLGTAEKYTKNHDDKSNTDTDEIRFLSKKELDLQHLTYKDIENLPLGKNIRSVILNLENLTFGYKY